MHKNTIAFVIAAALAGFIGGFWLANSINRSAQNSIGQQNISVLTDNSLPDSNAGEFDLSDQEIRTKIDEADKNPENFAFQKDLGISLYRYAAVKQDASLLPEAARLLERANSLKSNDFDVLVTLGNAHFDIGFANKDAASFRTARDVYSKALELKPGDPDVKTDFGLTYFLQEPPAYDKAAAELQKVADQNPRHERSLQFLVQTFIKQNKLAEAEKTLARLKGINPNNPAIADISAKIATAQSGT